MMSLERLGHFATRIKEKLYAFIFGKYRYSYLLNFCIQEARVKRMKIKKHNEKEWIYLAKLIFANVKDDKINSVFCKSQSNIVTFAM